jgi:hypothetical protein
VTFLSAENGLTSKFKTDHSELGLISLGNLLPSGEVAHWGKTEASFWALALSVARGLSIRAAKT